MPTASVVQSEPSGQTSFRPLAAPQLDVYLSSPPSFAGEPRDLADRAWRAGPTWRDIAMLSAQTRERLASDGRMYLLLSTDSHLGLLGNLIKGAGFAARLVAEHPIFIEFVSPRTS